MTRQTEADIEILVCTPAAGRPPRGLARESARESKRQNARYRKLARTYESFTQQPVTRTDICCTPSTSLPTSVATTSSKSVVSEAYRQLDETAPPLGSVLSAQYWSLSFESVCDNVQSPGVRYVMTEAEVEDEVEVEAFNNSPMASAELLVSKIQPRTVSKRHSYVSPDDYIPDSQPESSAKPRARKQRLTLDDDIEVVSDVDFDETRILESQDLEVDQSYVHAVVDDIEDVEDDDSPPKQTRVASPDLSAMPLDLDPLEDSILEDGSQELPQLSLADRQPLSQTSANSQSHQSQLTARHGEKEGHIPSSLLDEAGKIVASISLKTSPCKPQTSSLPLPVPIPVPIPSPKRRWADKHQPRYQHHLVDEIEDADQTDSTSSFSAPIEITEITETIETNSGPVYSRHDSDLRILSPEPPVGCDHLNAASLITERLAKLAQRLDLTYRFTKVAVRETNRVRLGPFDRGYWAVDTATWPAGQRQESWDFLTKYVSRGDAGWGVWCSRKSQDDRQLRLHCFEATAGHTYLLLYLASKRLILSTGVVWIDASGSPAITIPARRRKDEGSSRPSSRSTSRPGTALTTA